MVGLEAGKQCTESFVFIINISVLWKKKRETTKRLQFEDKDVKDANSTSSHPADTEDVIIKHGFKMFPCYVKKIQ